MTIKGYFLKVNGSYLPISQHKALALFNRHVPNFITNRRVYFVEA